MRRVPSVLITLFSLCSLKTQQTRGYYEKHGSRTGYCGHVIRRNGAFFLLPCFRRIFSILSLTDNDAAGLTIIYKDENFFPKISFSSLANEDTKYRK